MVFLPPAYLVQWEGNVFSLFLCSPGGGGSIPWCPVHLRGVSPGPVQEGIPWSCRGGGNTRGMVSREDRGHPTDRTGDPHLRTGYPVGDTPLAVTQEDFLVDHDIAL